MKFKNIYVIVLAVVIGFTSCSDEFLETDYTNGVDGQTATELAKTNPAALEGYLNGIFSHLVKFGIHSSAHDDFSYMSVLHSSDMMTEDIVQEKSHWFTYDYQLDNRQMNYRRPSMNWKVFYTAIAMSNEIINFFPEEPESADSKGILGQALAVRGMSYYYLIQLYQHSHYGQDPSLLNAPGVPLRFSNVEGLSEEEALALTGRNTVQVVLDQAEADLKKSVTLLDAGYERPQKYFIDASVAKGLLARYYLLTRQWALAASTAADAREGYDIMSKSDLHDGFMDIKNGEWMWGFDHNTETQTTYASFFSHISNLAGGYAGIGYAPRLIDARLYSFIGQDDERRKLFCGPNGAEGDQLAVVKDNPVADRAYGNLKFGTDGNWTMDYPYMRAAEMVLIEAEAKAHLEDFTGAATALKVLMENRDESWSESSVTVEDVLMQKRIELWGEGFGFFDLKRNYKGIDRSYDGNNHRTGVQIKVDAGDKRWIYQIPISEIQENDLIDEADNNE